MSEASNQAAIESLVRAINARDHGRIAQETAYWSKPFPAPEWRAPCIERM